MKNNEISPMPLPLAPTKMQKEDYLRAFSVDKWDVEKSYKILVHISQGDSFKEACVKEGTNVRSLHYYALSNPEYNDNLKMAQRLNARAVYSNVQAHFINQLKEMEDLPVKDKAVVMNRLYKYFERFTSLHDEEQDLKLRQAKKIAEMQEENKKAEKKGVTLVVKGFLEKADKSFDVQKVRVDRDDAEGSADKYYRPNG